MDVRQLLDGAGGRATAAVVGVLGAGAVVALVAGGTPSVGRATAGASTATTASSGVAVVDPEEQPRSLQRVVATNGRMGYVDRVLLEHLSSGPATTSDAPVTRLVRPEPTWFVEEIPVYAEDGVTPIGVLPVESTVR